MNIHEFFIYKEYIQEQENFWIVLKSLSYDMCKYLRTHVFYFLKSGMENDCHFVGQGS